MFVLSRAAAAAESFRASSKALSRTRFYKLKQFKSKPGHLTRKPTLRHYILPHVDSARMYVQDRISFLGGLAVISPNLRFGIIK